MPNHVSQKGLELKVSRRGRTPGIHETGLGEALTGAEVGTMWIIFHIFGTMTAFRRIGSKHRRMIKPTPAIPEPGEPVRQLAPMFPRSASPFLTESWRSELSS